MITWLRENPLARIIMTVLRVFVGWEWLTAGYEKIGSATWTGANAGVSISSFLHEAVSLSGGAHPVVQSWYATFLKDIAIPSSGVLTYVIAYGEFLVGLGLILGCFTTFAALMGAVMNTAYLLAGTVSMNVNLLIVEVLILIAGSNAAAFGLDKYVIPYISRLWARHISKGRLDE